MSVTPRTKPKKEQSVAVARVDREPRRKEIQRRWNHRAALNHLHDEGEKWESWRASSSVTAGVALLYGQWMPYREFLEHGELTHDELLDLCAHLLRVIVLKEMPYSDYLQTDEWKARATSTKERANGECALDASHPAEHAHHRTYTRRGRELASDLIALCADCHAKFHGWHT